MSLHRPIRIATRSSPLAIAQAEEVKARLLAAHPQLAEHGIELIHFVTSGDRNLEVKLNDIGGKGLFTKELEDALLSGAVDMAVHSMKDMTSTLPENLCIAALLEREDPRDGLVGSYTDISLLPPQARLGTASPRRAAQVLMLRPDLIITHLRGNVATRLRKIEQHEADCTLLAMAGLNRLGLKNVATPIATDVMLPAVAQGAIGIECHTQNDAIRTLLAHITHQPTVFALAAERAFLAELEGSCRTPIAGYAHIASGQLHFEGLITSPDGKTHLRCNRTGTISDGAVMGKDAAQELLANGGSALFGHA